MFPAPLQERHFFFPTHQRGQPSRGDGIEAVLHTTLAQNAIDGHWRCHAFEGARSQRLRGKVPLHEPEGRRTDDHRIRRRYPLDMGGYIGCFT